MKELKRKRTALALLLVLVQANGNGEDDCSVEHFFSAVDKSKSVGAVPSNLANLVRYAVFVDNKAVDEHEEKRRTSESASHTEERDATEENGETRSDGSIHISVHSKIVDGFDPGVLEFWEKVKGGSVSTACGSVSGEALCFNGEGNRYVAMNSMDIVDGGQVHFSLYVSDDGAPA
eukprot:CAMPEP_0198213916 /NCGR_PEP_ID=MMETSP1445-20131203/35304_1 /TAXON_ID=36898 /ORGANISM="Pyramimonas sp., Strain CCMP2087" /LENGTH=175 /DNA_ID=CAMNT_0043888785 /DNA_START=35 /DNA_END=558 /DNA_ORIENTATION=-